MIGAGNDKQVNYYNSCVTSLTLVHQFKLLAERILNQPELASDPKFSSNKARVANRAELIPIITEALMQHERDHWLQEFSGLGYPETLTRFTSFLTKNPRVPFGPINNLEQTFAHPQALARGVTVEVEV